jgi:dTDP-4-amino-4,6-dideoxygalactose transaminase
MTIYERIPFLNLSPMHNLVMDKMKLKFEEVLIKSEYINGCEVRDFEKEYSIFNGVSYTVGVGNGLDALRLSLLALGIGPGDEVIVPSNTFIATALAVSHVGAKPVFIEPDLCFYNMDPSRLGSLITEKTKAIIPVHLYGQSCDMESIINFAKSKGLFVIEDNAQAHGASHNGILTGSWGDINAVSFYPGKNLGALGDAGGITTNSLDLSDKIRTLANYGSRVKYYNDEIGYNSRLDEFQASILRIKLKHLMEWTVQRQKLALYYSNALRDIGDLILPVTHKNSTHVFHLYVIRTRKRNELKEYLSKNGIDCLIHYPVPPHLQKAYIKLKYKLGDFPIAEELSLTSLSLPLWVGMSNEQVERVCSVIKDFFRKNN